jgi:hypothetical protein
VVVLSRPFEGHYTVVQVLILLIGSARNRDAPDTELVGFPANIKAGYHFYIQFGRIPNIRPDFVYIF